MHLLVLLPSPGRSFVVPLLNPSLPTKITKTELFSEEHNKSVYKRDNIELSLLCALVLFVNTH